MATTLTLCSLLSEFLLEILGESAGFMGIQVVQGCEGVGGISGIQGGSGGNLYVLSDFTRLTQELRPKV